MTLQLTRRSCTFGAVLGAVILSLPAIAAAPNWPDLVDEHIAQVRKSVNTIDMDAYPAILKNPNGALLIDVRNEDEFELGHIPGTINISRGRLEMQIWKPLGYPAKTELNRKIYISCGSGARAVLAAQQLKVLGFTNVTAVPFNINEWQKKKYPFVTVDQK
jgi:rhodanese-related sulfurtransferase